FRCEQGAKSLAEGVVSNYAAKGGWQPQSRQGDRHIGRRSAGSGAEFVGGFQGRRVIADDEIHQDFANCQDRPGHPTSILGLSSSAEIRVLIELVLRRAEYTSLNPSSRRRM